MHQHLAHLAEMMGQQRQRRPLDRISVPTSAIPRLYELVDEMQASKQEEKGVILAARALWRYVYEILPFTVGKDIAINTSNILSPTIDVYGEQPPPTIGKKGVVALFEIPEEHLYKFIELCEGEDDSLTAKHALWSFVTSLTKLRHEDDEGRRIINSVCLDVAWTGIVSKVEEE